MSRSLPSAAEEERAPRGPRGPRPLSLVAGAFACFSAMAIADSLSRGGTVVMDGLWDVPFVTGLGSFQARPEREIEGSRAAGFRLMGEGESVVLKRLARRSPVTIELTLGPLGAVRDLELEVLANDVPIATATVTHAFKTIAGAAFTDSDGTLAIQIRSARESVPSPLPVRLVVIRASWPAGGIPPGLSLALYALIAAGGAVWAAGARSWGRGLAFVVPAGSVVLLSAVASLHVRSCLPALASAFLVSATILLLGRWVGMSAPAATWVAVLAGSRVAFALVPAFPSIDALFHAHNIHRFQAGQTITSEVSDAAGGSHAIPYGITLYALLAPFVAPGDYVHGEIAVRALMALLEGTAPIAVFLIMRAAGSSPEAASGAGQIAAALPQSLLVIAEGIAANTLGEWLSLWAIWGLLRRRSLAIPAVLIGLVIATHPGTAVTLAALILFWTLLLWPDERSRPEAHRLILGLLAGGALGVLLYYRQVFGVAWAFVSHLRAFAGGDRFLAFRWIHLGKIVQDLLLKFGGVPAVLAAAYWTRPSSDGRRRPLLTAWLCVYGAGAILAVFTPLAFRFEYFFAPAVAMAAASAGSGSRWVRRATVAAAAVQLLLGIAALYQWFDLINVIIPSLRWPLGGVTRTLRL